MNKFQATTIVIACVVTSVLTTGIIHNIKSQKKIKLSAYESCVKDINLPSEKLAAIQFCTLAYK